MTHDEALESPGVHFPPPVVFIAGYLIGWLLDARVHRWRLAESAERLRTIEMVGLVLLVAGLLLGAWGILTFWRVRTSILPFRPASSFVIAGPYRFTRNPMYVGLTVAYIGLSMMTALAWALVVLPLVLIALYALVIRREERYMRHAFGADYVAYARRVRRWL